MYISTEDAFPNKRLQQLTEAFAQKHKELGLSAQQLSDNIYVEHAATIVRVAFKFLALPLTPPLHLSSTLLFSPSVFIKFLLSPVPMFQIYPPPPSL